MIPQFPSFKPLELSDQAEIESIVRRFLPYSDFNFVSMWCWNILDQMAISLQGGNLIVRFNDYITNQPFLSFIGSGDCDQTVRLLINYSVKMGMGPALKLVPEVVVKKLKTGAFIIKEDRDNFDYVYSVNEVGVMKGSKFSTRRNYISRFLNRHTGISVRVVDLKDKAIQASMLILFETWVKNKIEKNKILEVLHEELALKRLFTDLADFDLIGIGVYLGNTLAGFSIIQLISEEYGISHFHKANSKYFGVFDFLMQEKAKHLMNLNIKYLNYEQDLGLAGLRQSKSLFRPVHFLKKYIVKSAS